MAFEAILTTIGQNKIADAVANTGTVTITEGAVGDGGGAATTPSVSDTALVSEVGIRYALNNIEADGNQITMEIVIPPTDGGYTIRELGFFDSVGDLIVVASVPENYKPGSGEGSLKESIYKATVSVQDAAVVDLTIDPSLVTATQEWVEDNFVNIVDSLATLQSITGIDTEDVRKVIGAGHFRWDGSSWIPTNYVTPSMFDTIENAISYCAANGLQLVGERGSTYVFESGITITDQPINIDFSGCKLERAAVGPGTSQPAVRVIHTHSADTFSDADDILAFSHETYTWENGDQTVVRLTVTDASLYSVGQIVKMMSTDRVPCISPWEDTRYSEMSEIGAIDLANNYLYMIRPLYENTWTPEKVVTLKNIECIVKGGEWYDEEGYPVTRNAQMIRIDGAVWPIVREVKTRDTASMGVVFASCYEPRHEDCVHDRARMFPTENAYGYGCKFIHGTTRPISTNAQGTGCRHIVDTGGGVVSDAQIATKSPLEWGCVQKMRVISGVGHDSINAPFCDHPDAYGSEFINCTADWTNRRSQGAALWGLEIRGRADIVYGGNYDSLNPIRIALSTDDKCVLSNVLARRHNIDELDAGYGDPAIYVDGTGVISGKANVHMTGMRLEVINGRREIISGDNADIYYDGDILYKHSEDSPVVVRANTDTTVTLGDIKIDFRGGVGINPTIARCEGANDSVIGEGTVKIKRNDGYNVVALCQFNNSSGTAVFHDVEVDGDLFGGDGWKDDASATLKLANIRRSDLVAGLSFMQGTLSGGGNHTLSWPEGRLEPVLVFLFESTNATNNINGISNVGAFPGQKIVLKNTAATLTADVSTGTNISVGATRTIGAGEAFELYWDGANWTA